MADWKKSDFCAGASEGYNDDESGRGKRSQRHYGGSDDYWKGYNAGYRMNEQQEDGRTVPKKVRDCFDGD